ncbi:MAG: hypothetical protein ACODAJ_00680 [Planctomycetota bacterium]
MSARAALAIVALAVALPSARAGKRRGNPRLQHYATALKAGRDDEVFAELLDRVDGHAGARELDAMASALARQRGEAEPVLRSLLERESPLAPGATAELLWRVAEKGRLGDGLAGLAAELLAHPDPFVASLADWAIAARVHRENKGARIAWPRPNPPEWYRQWTASLTPEFVLQSDYARLAVDWHIHHRGRKLLSSVGAILRRADGAASEVLVADPPTETRAMVQRQLDAIRAIQARLTASLEEAPHDITAHRTLWLDARRAARPIVMANPAIDFDRVAFITRHGNTFANITGSQYPWSHKPGGDLCVQDGLAPGASVRRVLDGALGPGHVHGMDLRWDADRLVFAYARQPDWPPKHDPVGGDYVFLLRGEQEPTHLYEIRLDGSGLRQVTEHPYWSDFEPTWCADGSIVFASDRSGRSSECGKFSADHTVINLYRVRPDGSGLRRLSDNKDIDRYPHSLDDGRIAYTRWEYQERHFFEVHAVWTVRPDGTMADAVFNQHLRAPFALRDVRSVPGSRRLVAIACGHHTLAYGPLVLIDPAQGINNPRAIDSVTPRIGPQEGPMAGRPVPQGGVPGRKGVYQTPWALSERCFLATQSYSDSKTATGFALYLIDAWGNKELIHRDPLLSCAFPIPVRRRPRPPVLPDVEPETDSAVCYVTDVYDGLEGVARGEVRHIRILQRVGWPLDEAIGAMRWIPGNAWERKFGFWAWAPVRVIGTVPVAADGSAHFRVPADTAVYFQALDERHMELRRMRSHVTFQPGERRGCRGCHETQERAPDHATTVGEAIRGEPDVPSPPPWGAEKLLGYEWLVQPILDRRCVRCHGAEAPRAGLDLTGTPTDSGFVQSFRSLFGHRADGTRGKPLVSVSDRLSDASISQPRQFGSHKSRLIRALLHGKQHRDVTLTDDEWLALVTWVDANAPYHDTFFNRRPADGGPARRDVRIVCPQPFEAP